MSLNNLASLYVNQGRYVEAKPLLERGLSICERVFGPDHAYSNVLRENYAKLQRKLRHHNKDWVAEISN
jgi:hypothetical protein